MRKGHFFFSPSSVHLFTPFSYLFALCFLFLLPFPTQAQLYRFKSYTSSTGLPSNTIYSLFQDSKGYLWIGTDSGLCRYDGMNYTTFSIPDGLPDTNVRSMCEDKKGRLWVTTEGGVSCYDGTQFTHYNKAQGLANNQTYSAICAHDGTLWFGTANGLSHFDGTRFTNYGIAQGLPAERIWALLEDSKGVLWIGQRGGGLIKFINGQFTRYGIKDGLSDERVFGLSEDPRGGLWITTSGGLCFFNGSQFRFYTTQEGLGSNFTDKSFVDKYQRVWISTFGSGLCRLETNGHITVFNRSRGMIDNYLTALLQDSEGNVWCGTRSSGLCRFSSELFAAYTTTSGLTNGTLTGIAQTSDGTLWFSSLGGGLSSLDAQGTIRAYGTKDGLLEMDLWAIGTDSKNHIWTSGYKGVSCFDGQHFQNFTREQLGMRDRITSIIEDKQGRMWFGSHPSTSNGVVSYDGKTFRLYTTAHGLLQNPVTSFTLDRSGNLLVGSEGGLSRFDGERFTNHAANQGLPGKRVRHAYMDEQGVLWIGTLEGLFRFDGKTFKTFTTKDGLPSNTVRAITSLNQELWVGTSRGIGVLNGNQFRSYTTKDGLVNDEIFTGACLRQPDGTLWFGTNDGAVRYRAMPEIGIPGIPRVYINSIRVQDKPVPITSKLDLSYQQNSLTLGFVGLSFTDEDAVRYSYFLEGFDTKWSEPTRDRTARFTNLPPGSYRFQIKAHSSSSAWSDPQIIEINIRHPFWQTWWFTLLMIAGVLGLIYKGYLNQIRDLERRQERKVALLRHIQEQRVASLRQLLESIRVINSQLELNTVLENIAQESAHLIGGEPGGIGLVEGDQIVFRRMWLQDHWQACSVKSQLGQGVAGKVAATGKALIVNDIQESPDIIFPEIIEQFYVHGFMDVPIITRRGAVVGVLDVRRRKDQPLLTQADCQLIEALANQAAVAIENAGLYGELEEKNIELEEKNLMIAESLRELERLYQQEQHVTRRLQELDQMKTNFMIVTSHEMRTPLTVLKGYTEALLEEYLGPLTEAQQKSLGTCQRMVDRLVASFSDILEMLKINEGRIDLKPTLFDLSTTVREVIGELSQFAAKRNQNLMCDIPKELYISADRERIQLILLNLIQNAIKFTYDRGDIRVYARQESDSIHLTVTDTGIGIEPQEIDRVFDKFYTNRDPSTHKSGKFEFATRGTGLGLAIAKSYVEAHNGRIWVESPGQGKGTSFHVVLPFVATSQEIVYSNQGENAQT